MIKNVASYTVLFFLLFIVQSGAYAQSEKRLIKEAEDNLKTGDKKNALSFYLKAYQMNPDNPETNFNIGKLYLETIYKGRSLSYLEKAFKAKPDIDKDINRLLGNSYQYNNMWDKAIEQYNTYLVKLPAADPQYKKIQRKIEECNNGKELMATPIDVKIENAGPAINTPYPEFAPVISADESVLIFTSRREGSTGGEMNMDGEYNEDIYISEKTGTKWAQAKNIGPIINTDGHDASIGLSADGTELFTYDGEGKGDIMYCNLRKDSSWSKPHLLSGDINTKESETSMCISPDGQTVYYTSDRPGGLGGFDIYMSHVDKNGDWGKAHNLGAPINTAEDEEGPFMDFDGRTLYFSSKAHKGMGGYDIFKTDYDSTTQKWSEPENIGYPINTADDDIYFVLSGNGKHGYYASVKDDGYGEKDIYIITMPDRKDYHQLMKKMEVLLKKELPKEPEPKPEPVVVEKNPEPVITLKPVIIKGIVYDQKTNQPLEAKVQFTNKAGKVIKEVTTGADGSFQFELSAKQSAGFLLSAKKDQYGFVTQNITVPAESQEEQVVEKDLYLKPLEVGSVFILRNIYYDFDKATLKQVSYVELEKLLKMLQENPNVKVKILGHTDSKGSDAYNKALSDRRAKMVVNWLESKGIAKSRLSAHGYGEEKPLATNTDEEEGRELNRRTEFEVIANK